MKSVTSRDLELYGSIYTFEQFKADELFHKPARPRRRALRQAQQQQIRASFVDRAITIGEQPQRWLARPWHQVLCVAVLVALLFVFVVLSGRNLEPFVP